ncbi:MAG TPA: GNAT family N-acetyltransferase [Pirellulaceae bacterium]|nr:GNAT family N-acetyltransferase [Pirellulaceae bacterium]
MISVFILLKGSRPLDILYREFLKEDLPRIKVITVEAFDGVSIDRNIDALLGAPTTQSWKQRKARHLDADLAREEAMILVAEIDQKVVGYISTWIDREASQGFIPNLAVDQCWRGSGIGRSLIERAIAYFREQGVTLVRIETLDQNAVGQKLYPSLGFQEVARQIHYCMNLKDGEAFEAL